MPNNENLKDESLITMKPSKQDFLHTRVVLGVLSSAYYHRLLQIGVSPLSWKQNFIEYQALVTFVPL